MDEELFRIGVITEPHGVQGEVKVYPTTDDPARLKKIKEIILDDGKEKSLLHLKGVKFQNDRLILRFEEFQTRDDVERLRKKELFVTRKNAVPLKKDEYYISDLVGLRVVDEDDVEVGVIREVLQTAANDVYEIERTNGETLLLPAIKQCVLDVDVEGGRMKVHVMEGL